MHRHVDIQQLARGPRAEVGGRRARVTAPPSLAAAVIARQRTAGNAAVANWVASDASPRRRTATARLHRHVMVANVRNDEPHVLLEQAWGEVSPANLSVLSLLVAGADPSLTATDVDDLWAQTNQISAMVELVEKIMETGILGRKTLTQQGIGYTGSADAGDATPLAVNVLDVRASLDAPTDASHIAEQSLAGPYSGSFSVAMERATLPGFQHEQEQIPPAPDVVREEMRLAAAEAEQQVRAHPPGNEGDDPMLVQAMLANAVRNARGDAIQRALATYRPWLEERTQNTVMALIPLPAKNVAHREPGVEVYESDVPEDVLDPGVMGFTKLLLPKWFEPFDRLLKRQQWPEDVTAVYVGTKQVTAQFKGPDGNIPVTVGAPDYASEIASMLQEFSVIATHIMKTGTA